ncbi:MAG: universal stress protein [Flavobacteriales bacterium]|nr:universal stress protein [Flavobacteriales bacterium]
MSTKRILVPTDFTKVADCAMNHAAALAERMGATVDVLHIVSKAADLPEARTKVAMEAERGRKWSSKVPFRPQVRVGSVYEEIGNTASELGAELIIMGTHGMRGMQFITGSRALRVITNSTVPFIVVQERISARRATTTSWCRWTCSKRPAKKWPWWPTWRSISIAAST